MVTGLPRGAYFGGFSWDDEIYDAFIKMFPLAETCPSGEYYKPETDVTGACTACPLDKYQDFTGRLDCSVCPAGRHTLSTGSKNITQCLREYAALCSYLAAVGRDVGMNSLHHQHGRLHDKTKVRRATKSLHSSNIKTVFFYEDFRMNSIVQD